MQTQKSFVSWVTVRTFSAHSWVWMPQKDPHVTPKVSYSVSNMLSKLLEYFMEKEN